MAPKIFNDGTDKYLIIPKITSVSNSSGDQNPVFGKSDGQLLSSIFSDLSVYWFDPKTSQEVKLTQVTWSNNLGMWKALIPSININLGTGWLSITGQTADGTESIIPLSVEVEIDLVPIRSIVPPAYYHLNTTTRTITLDAPYNTITAPEIVSIRNLTRQNEIYNSSDPKRHTLFLSLADKTQDYDIKISNGVLTYITRTHMEDTDDIQIRLGSKI